MSGIDVVLFLLGAWAVFGPVVGWLHGRRYGAAMVIGMVREETKRLAR